MPKPSTVAIIPGFAEGRYLTRGLRQALFAAGYNVIEDAARADIIIAHSGGCYWVPRENQAKAVLHIGYPYWPGRSLPRAAGMKIADEYQRMKLLPWLNKSTLNTFYILRFMNTLRMIQGYSRRQQVLSQLPSGQIFVGNRYDPYTRGDAIEQVAGDGHVYITLPGYHDQLWLEPEPYVNLLKSIV